MTADPPEYDHHADLTPPHFLDRDEHDPTNCKQCGDVNGYGVLHLTEEPLPELQTTCPLLPEDSVDFWHTPCPVCRVTSGSCVSTSGYYRPAHPQRLDKAREVA